MDTYNEVSKLQAAIRDLFREMDWPDGGDLDGFAFQEWAERHGFLRAETRTSFCAKGCACSEYCNGNVGVLGNSGFICHRKVEWLAAPDSAAELSRSQKMTAAGFTRRPSWRALPDDDAPIAAPAEAPQGDVLTELDAIIARLRVEAAGLDGGDAGEMT